MNTWQKKERCYFFCYEGVVEGINVGKRVKTQDFGLETFFVKGSNMENIATSAGSENWRSRILFFVCLHTFHVGWILVSGFISIFLRAIVLQPDSPTECINNPMLCADSPSEPILVVFSPTNHWSYSTIGLSIRWSRPVYCKFYFS